jgi:hypothetical protein
VFVTIAGSIISALTGFAIKELPGRFRPFSDSEDVSSVLVRAGVRLSLRGWMGVSPYIQLCTAEMCSRITDTLLRASLKIGAVAGEVSSRLRRSVPREPYPLAQAGSLNVLPRYASRIALQVMPPGDARVLDSVSRNERLLKYPLGSCYDSTEPDSRCTIFARIAWKS